jgi:hypothetical protein
MEQQMADNDTRHGRTAGPFGYRSRHFGMAGGYGQGGPALNYGGDDVPGPYRLPPAPSGQHAGRYEARHYRQISEREPQQAPFGVHRLHDEEGFSPERIDRALARHDHAGKGPRNYRRSDRRIAEDVSDLLTDDNFLDASNIEVAVDAGEVLLQGTVDSRADKRRAEDLALSVKGVADVRNSLRLEDGNANTTPLAFGDGR